MSKKATIDALRADYVAKTMEMLKTAGEDVLVVGSNEIAIPVVDGEGEEQYIVFKIQVPTGSRDGDAYEGYAMAEDYAMKQRDKAEKAAKAAEEKAKKIARDQKMREQKKAAAEKREGKSSPLFSLSFFLYIVLFPFYYTTNLC